MKQVKIKLPLRALTLASGLLLTVSSFAQTAAIKGHVKDASGEPIMGATITVNGKAVGITDMDGNFTLEGVKNGDIIQISFIGYTTQEIKYTGQSTLQIKLAEDTQKLEEVVVVGYGVQKKSDVTGALSSVKPDRRCRDCR